MENNFRQLSCISVSSFWSGGLKCRRTKDISNFMSEFMFHAFRVCLCEVGFATAEVRVKSQNPSPTPPKRSRRELKSSRRELKLSRRELKLTRRELKMSRRELKLSRREFKLSRRDWIFTWRELKLK